MALTLSPALLSAQVTLRPTPAPTVTADNEPWYQSREPVVVGGNVYYPAGAKVFFDGNDMVLSGAYGKVPLYTRKTLEPYSFVFVPLGGGTMQPYERRRSGELAGTVGSTTSSFPVQSPTEGTGGVTAGAQAPGPPTNVPAALVGEPAQSGSATAPVPATEPVATSATPPATGQTASAVSAAKPEGLNGVFVEYAGKRWFSSGPAVLLTAKPLTRIGQYRGLAVYAERARNPETIYVAVAQTAQAMVAPYSTRRP